MRHRTTLSLIIVLVLTYSITPVTSGEDANSLIHGIEVTCEKLYFINYIHIANSTINETLVLETPGNISLPYGFNQTALIIYRSEGLRFNDTLRAMVFDVVEGESFTGYFVEELTICAPDRKTLFNHVALAQVAPYLANPPSSPHVPNSPPAQENYLVEPHRTVASRVREDFEKWLTTTYKGLTPRNLSSFALSVLAASFIYGYYIRYNASPYPRSIEEVVETRMGDCDDMSRVLVELLNTYEIPSLMITGYDIVWNNYTIDVEGFKYRYINNGPHAFTAAYIQGVGWISLDLLAGGMLTYPFIVEGYGRDTAVNQTVVEEFKDLHRKISGFQVIAVFKEDAVRDYLENKTLDAFINSLIASGREDQASTTTSSSTIGSDNVHPPHQEKSEDNLPKIWEWVALAMVLGVALILAVLLVFARVKKALVKKFTG